MSEENLPVMIGKAAAALSNATTAAEILEAKTNAGIIYDAAQRKARLAKIKDAHGTVVAACRKIQADALEIDAQAQIRLADEYDAAQERGEVAKQGDLGRNRSSQKEHLSTVTDIGLTRKQVHEARKIRDAEKANPGVVRKVLDEQLKAGAEPTRAHVKRAIKGDDGKRSTESTRTGGMRRVVKSESNHSEDHKQSRKQGRRERPHKSDHSKKLEAASLFLDRGLSRDRVKEETGLGLHEIQLAVERERGRREAEPQITPETLSMSAQQKLDAAIRQHKRALDAEYDVRVRDESRRLIETTILPAYNKERDEYRAVIETRKGVMTAALYRKISAALHPDNFADEGKKHRAESLFVEWRKLAIKLMDEKEMPTVGAPLPRTYDELMKEKEKVRAARAAARTAKSTMAMRA
jgi:hypothetical protein